MIFALGFAFVVFGVLAAVVSYGKQKQMTATIASEAKKRPDYQLNRQGEISGLYTKMKAKFSKDEQSIKNLKMIGIGSTAIGIFIIIAGLVMR